MPASRIWTEIDFELAGKQVGYLHLPHSSNESAYGTIAIPAAVVRNGEGPTILIMGGIHGDEYEAQIQIGRLIRELEPEYIQGRVILIPAINLPAAMAGARVSPIDDLNMNRCFPGNPDGSPTEQLAFYVDSVLLPMCDMWLDWHSGGSSLNYIPLASVHRFKDEALTRKNIETLTAFGAPVSVIWSFFDEPRMAKGCAERHGLIYLGSEFGGGGSVNQDGVRLAYEGTMRVLAHLNILVKPSCFDFPPAEPVKYYDIKSRHHNVYAPSPGLFEPIKKLGGTVESGDRLGFIHYIDNPAQEPTPINSRVSGTILCLRHAGRTQRGDCVVQIGTEVSA